MNLSDKVNKLFSLCTFGQNLLAIPVRGPAQYKGWVDRVGTFNDRIEYMAELLRPSEFARLRHADPEGIPFEREYDSEHGVEWRKLKRRVSAL